MQNLKENKMIKPKDAPLYAVMDEDNDLVWAANHYAFYKTIEHAKRKVSRSRGGSDWRVVKVVYEEVEDE